MKIPENHYHFVTDHFVLVPAVTTEQMQEIDRIAIQETGPNLFQMMENAGRSLAELTMHSLNAAWQNSHIVVLAGTGGNGGGGMVAARHLVNRHCRVTLCVTHPERLDGVPAQQYQLFKQAGGRVEMTERLKHLQPDFIIDAIIGYSLKGHPRGRAQQMIRWANAQNCPILSLDVPSGVNATDGSTPGDFVHCDQTLTLALPKIGLGKEFTGDLFLADLGIPFSVYHDRLALNYIPPFGTHFWIHLNRMKEYEK